MDLPLERSSPSRHYVVGGNLAPGTVVGDGEVVYQAVPLNNFIRGRFFLQLSANDGTFRFRYARPGENGGWVLTDYSQIHDIADDPLADEAVGDTTEVVTDPVSFNGEGYIIIRYTDTAGGSTIGRVTLAGLA